MKILTLSIKQKFFDEIISGKKKNEYREVRPSTFDKYLRYIYNGKEYKNSELPDDVDVDIQPIKYDAIKFLTGEYKGTRPFITVAVKKAELQILTDDNDEDIIYEENGIEYVAAQMNYTLGEIIDKNV